MAVLLAMFTDQRKKVLNALVALTAPNVADSVPDARAAVTNRNKKKHRRSGALFVVIVNVLCEEADHPVVLVDRLAEVLLYNSSATASSRIPKITTAINA